MSFSLPPFPQQPTPETVARDRAHRLAVDHLLDAVLLLKRVQEPSLRVDSHQVLRDIENQLFRLYCHLERKEPDAQGWVAFEERQKHRKEYVQIAARLEASLAWEAEEMAKIRGKG